MMKKVFILLSVFVFISQNARAMQEMKREDWTKAMAAMLPGLLCKEGTFFMECFSITKEECVKVSTEKFNQCAEKNAAKMPAVLKLPEDGKTWGGSIGYCTGVDFTSSLSSKLKTDNPKCLDSKAWSNTK